MSRLQVTACVKNSKGVKLDTHTPLIYLLEAKLKTADLIFSMYIDIQQQMQLWEARHDAVQHRQAFVMQARYAACIHFVFQVPGCHSSTMWPQHSSFVTGKKTMAAAVVTDLLISFATSRSGRLHP